MKRTDLEHILRASKGTTGEEHFIIIGSQSVLGKHPDAPKELRNSMELDIYPRFRPDLSEMLEGSLGRYSQFDFSFGYHADGVGPETALLPAGWEDRLIPVCNENTGGATGWCLAPCDLAIAKLKASRPKDLTFVRALLRHHLIRPVEIEQLIAGFADEAVRAHLSTQFHICRRRED